MCWSGTFSALATRSLGPNSTEKEMILGLAKVFNLNEINSFWLFVVGQNDMASGGILAKTSMPGAQEWRVILTL